MKEALPENFMWVLSHPRGWLESAHIHEVTLTRWVGESDSYIKFIGLTRWVGESDSTSGCSLTGWVGESDSTSKCSLTRCDSESDSTRKFHVGALSPDEMVRVILLCGRSFTR